MGVNSHSKSLSKLSLWDSVMGLFSRRDKDGFDKKGYDIDGFDKYGFSNKGIRRTHRNGTRFDERGFYFDGEHRNRTRFDDDGFDRDGFNKDGFDHGGIHKLTGTKLDERGFNKDGTHRNGTRFDEYGFTKDEFDQKALLQQEEDSKFYELCQERDKEQEDYVHAKQMEEDEETWKGMHESELDMIKEEEALERGDNECDCKEKYDES